MLVWQRRAAYDCQIVSVQPPGRKRPYMATFGTKNLLKTAHISVYAALFQQIFRPNLSHI
jgi:hypothetical protein